MLTVVLDTTVLRSDPARKKQAFQTLERLAADGEVAVYLPEMAIREFLSSREERHNKYVSTVLSNINHLKKKSMSSKSMSFLENSEIEFTNLETELNNVATKQLEDWIKDNSATVIPISTVNIEKVIDNYFAGNHPFQSQKSRSDFPDAFIWEAVLALLASVNDLYFITDDKKFRDGAKSHKGITSLSSLDEFVKTDEIQKIIRSSNADKNIERVIELIQERINDIEESILNGISDISTELKDKTVDSYYIPDDNNEAIIEYAYPPSKLKLKTDEVEYYGEGRFIVPSKITSDAEISYCIFKADFWCLDDERVSSISIGERNDHYFSAEESLPIDIELNISLSLDYEILEQEDVPEDVLLKAICDSSVEIDSIEDISLNFDSDD